MRRNGRLAVLAAVLAAFASQTPLALAHGTHRRCRGSALRPARQNIVRVTRSTLCLIDRLRRAHHLRPLHASRPLHRIASGQSADMAIGHYFGDASLSGQSPLARIVSSGYFRGRGGSISVAQNIAWGTGGDARPAAIVRAWMRSAPHRAILLGGAFHSIGVGIHRGTPSAGAGGATYTVDLAS